MGYTILIPAAGNGRRFKEAGYDKPKPLIDIAGKPMIEWATQTVSYPDAEIIFLARSIGHIPPMGWRSSRIIEVKKTTEGAACTALLARKYISYGDSLVIANCDQYIEWYFPAFLEWAAESGCDGAIVTFEASDPKWSYVSTDFGRIVEVREKQVISNEATVGIYYWRHSWDFLHTADRMIAANDRYNGEFYIAPTYNYLIEDGGIVLPYRVPNDKVHGLGTPEDVEAFKEYMRAPTL